MRSRSQAEEIAATTRGGRASDGGDRDQGSSRTSSFSFLNSEPPQCMRRAMANGGIAKGVPARAPGRWSCASGAPVQKVHSGRRVPRIGRSWIRERRLARLSLGTNAQSMARVGVRQIPLSSEAHLHRRARYSGPVTRVGPAPTPARCDRARTGNAALRRVPASRRRSGESARRPSSGCAARRRGRRRRLPTCRSRGPAAGACPGGDTTRRSSRRRTPARAEASSESARE